MRTSTRVAVALLTLMALVGLYSANTASAGEGGQGGQGNEDNVTFCHRTNSNANPYVIITTDPSGENGGTDHLHEHEGPLWDPTLKQQKIEWGDVIPPPADDPQGPGSQAYEELIDAGGDWEDFLENDCQMPEQPEVPTHSVTLDKVTEGDSAPAASTQFTFTVECESGTETSPVSIAASDAPVVVATGVAEDDLCTITETESNEADDISFAVTGGTEDSSTADSVTVGVGADTAVVATNGYDDVLGEVVTKPKPPAPAPEVEAADQLPKTGAMTPYYAMAGAALLLVGAMARLASRRLSTVHLSD
jgi:LPXTG-motif cell wall-anchored protein